MLVGIVGFRCLRAVAFGFQMTSLGLFGIQTLLIVSSRSRVPPSANMAILQYIKMHLQSNLGCGPGSSRFETRVTYDMICRHLLETLTDTLPKI